MIILWGVRDSELVKPTRTKNTFLTEVFQVPFRKAPHLIYADSLYATHTYFISDFLTILGYMRQYEGVVYTEVYADFLFSR